MNILILSCVGNALRGYDDRSNNEKVWFSKTKNSSYKKIKLSDGWHLRCKWLECPSQIKEYKTNKPSGICQSIILNNTIQTKYCFCG